MTNCILYSLYCSTPGEGIEGFMDGADSAAMMISLSWGRAFQLIREFEVLQVASGCWFWMSWCCSCVLRFVSMPQRLSHVVSFFCRVIWRPSASMDPT